MTSDFEARRAMDADLAEANAAYNSWMTAGSTRGHVDVVKWYLDKAISELAQAIEKNHGDTVQENLKPLASSLAQVKKTAESVSEEWVTIIDERLKDYRKICGVKDSEN